jgi:hypothetical protein
VVLHVVGRRVLPECCEPGRLPAAKALAGASSQRAAAAEYSLRMAGVDELFVCLAGKVQLRRTHELKSKKCGHVLPGEVIRVLERREVPEKVARQKAKKMVLRVRCGGGWCRMTGASEEPLFEPVGPFGMEETAVGRGWSKDAQRAAKTAQERAQHEREREINQARQLAAPADYDEATMRMLVEAMGGNAAQCPACGMVISKEGGDDQVMCGCEAQPAGGTLEKALAGGGCGHQVRVLLLSALHVWCCACLTHSSFRGNFSSTSRQERRSALVGPASPQTTGSGGSAATTDEDRHHFQCYNTDDVCKCVCVYVVIRINKCVILSSLVPVLLQTTP